MSDASARLLVSVTVPAQAWLVKQLADDHVDILTMIEEGHVAETAQPGPRKLARSRQADIQFIVGHPALFFESRYMRIEEKPESMPRVISLFDVAKKMQPHRALQGTDPHLWTSVSIMQSTIAIVADSLSQLDPENADIYRKNQRKLYDSVSQLDKQIRKQLEKKQQREFLVYHPAWSHFSQDYGLHQRAIEAEGKTPSPGSLSGLMRHAEEKKFNFIISAPGTDRRRAEIIARQLQIELILIDPMDPDWMQMIDKMKSAMEKL